MIFTAWLLTGQKGDDMEKKEFALFASALKTYYPKEQLLPNNQAMELWYRQLQDIPYQIAELALNKWVATNKWSPSIADIREMSTAVKVGDKPLWSDGWEEVLRAISRFGSYRESEALQSMTDITRQAVKRLGFRNICMSENIMTDRANFRMIFEQIADRQHTSKQLPVSLTNLIEAVREKENQMLIEGKGESNEGGQ